jgi:hypothetical protein
MLQTASAISHAAGDRHKSEGACGTDGIISKVPHLGVHARNGWPLLSKPTPATRSKAAGPSVKKPGWAMLPEGDAPR